MDRPKACRSKAYCKACSKAALVIPTYMAAHKMRSSSRLASRWYQPRPRSPNTADSGALASSKKTSQVQAARMPINSNRRTVTAGCWRGVSTSDMPLARLPSVSGSVRHSTKMASASSANEVYSFWPRTVHSPWFKLARVFRLNTSVPPPGSLMPKPIKNSPWVKSGR